MTTTHLTHQPPTQPPDHSHLPPPSFLTPFSHLSHTPPGTRLRFAGLVSHYHAPSCTLLLTSQHPTTTHKITEIQVSISLALETTDSELLRKGAWVSVLGTVEYPPVHEQGRGGEQGRRRVKVQAMCVWDASGEGVVAMERYGRVVEARGRAVGVIEGARRRWCGVVDEGEKEGEG